MSHLNLPYRPLTRARDDIQSWALQSLALVSQRQDNTVRVLNAVLTAVEKHWGETVPSLPGILESVRHALHHSDRTVRQLTQTTAAFLQAQPITGYDTLTANQVVQSLHGLTAKELQAVRQYEANHKNRTSVLRALDTRLKPCHPQ